MKKNLVWMLTAILFCGLTTTVLTSCSSSSDESDIPVSVNYLVTGDLVIGIVDASTTEIPSNWGMVGPLKDYTEAVGNVAPVGNTENKDSQVKSACDEVYNKHMKLAGIKITGTVAVTKTTNGKDDVVVWSKTY